MERCLALTKECKMTYCTASEENIGKGRCNHIARQKNNESVEDFCKRVENRKENDRVSEIKNLATDDKIELIESEDVNDKNHSVRAYVTKHGRDKDLDILVNDQNQYVRNTAIKNKNSKSNK